MIKYTKRMKFLGALLKGRGFHVNRISDRLLRETSRQLLFGQDEKGHLTITVLQDLAGILRLSDGIDELCQKLGIEYKTDWTKVPTHKAQTVMDGIIFCFNITQKDLFKTMKLYGLV